MNGGISKINFAFIKSDFCKNFGVCVFEETQFCCPKSITPEVGWKFYTKFYLKVKPALTKSILQN